MTDQNNLPTKTEFLLYRTDDGNIRIETRMENETVWLTQAQMCELFDKNKRTISEHIRNIFSEGELREEQVVRKFRTTAADGKNYLVAHYNLDVIISVGYRVKSHRGTQFRIWATQRLREYIIKGFTMDDERLKQAGGGNYFDELQALNRNPMYMRDWIARLDDFLKLSGRYILTHAGKISHEKALDKAHQEYKKYRREKLSAPTAIEKHFAEVEKGVKQLKAGKKRRDKNG